MRFNYTVPMLEALNSATKYPSIETYHALGGKGRLLEKAIDFGDDQVIVTEKLDGTNVRLIFDHSGDLFIGSREELLTHADDVVRNPALGIVDALLETLQEVWRRPDVHVQDHIFVIYVELFGNRQTPAWRQYGDGTVPMWRMFDACTVPEDVLEWPKARVASWRDGGGQTFLDEWQLGRLSLATSIHRTPRVTLPKDGGDLPGRFGTDLPKDVAGMYDFMLQLGDRTRIVSPTNNGAQGKSEGFVLRTPDRTKIAKARFEDYERTLIPARQRPARASA